MNFDPKTEICAGDYDQQADTMVSAEKQKLINIVWNSFS